MEDAKSMYHGGELVSALDCDFESYRELGLLCPFCNEPVYLCGETVRQSSRTHKLSYIRPHFKHFPGGDPMDFDCEKRAISAEGKRYLDAIRAERRGQRLELFNRYLWEMFTDGLVIGELSNLEKFACLKPKACLNSITQKMKIKLPTNAITSAVKNTQHFINIIDLRTVFDSLADGTINSKVEFHHEDRESDPVAHQERMLSIFCRASKKYHFAVCDEIIDYLLTRKAFPFLVNSVCFTMAIYIDRRLKNGWNIDEVLEHVTSRPNFFAMPLVLSLCTVNWQQQLEEKSKLLRTDTAGRGFAKAR